jgi:hypothetical protein
MAFYQRKRSHSDFDAAEPGRIYSPRSHGWQNR